MYLLYSYEPDRIWVTTRGRGVQRSTVMIGDKLVAENAGASYEAGPEAWSFSFNSDGLCYR